MARSDRYLIAPFTSGLQTDLKPWLIPNEAFSKLTNAYVFRGRVRKRFGERLLIPSGVTPSEGYESLHSRLRINIGSTDSNGDISPAVSVPGDTQGTGVMFSIGDQIYTCTASGSPATMKNTGSGTVTYDSSAKTFEVTGAHSGTGPNTVYFYPGNPVMGLLNYENESINLEPTYAFDTRFSYSFTSNGWERLGTSEWSGSNSDYFWGSSWRGIDSDDTYLFVTNYVANDGIKYYDGSSWTKNSAGTNVNYTPVVNNTNRMLTSRIVIPFKDRLIALSTKERSEGANVGTTDATTGNFSHTVTGSVALGQSFVVNNTVFTIKSTAAGAQSMTVKTIASTNTPPTATFNFSTKQISITGNGNNPSTDVYFFDGSTGSTSTYVNRCRFSQNGSPVESAANEPNSVAAWLEAPGLGGYIDAPTKEAIVTAQFLYDRLIVYFERSTWELVYTGNQVLPFVWQKINTELGAESTFSEVPFDRLVLGIGQTGIHACNGSNVERIDHKIPDEVFNFHNIDSSTERLVGIRDYYNEFVYWTVPDNTRDTNEPFNNKILLYNYKDRSWAFNLDSITTFGYFQAETAPALQWQNKHIRWSESHQRWRGTALQAAFRNIIAGNQQGYTFLLSPGKASNCAALQITDITYSGDEITITCFNHNLKATSEVYSDYIMLENIQGITGLDEYIAPIDEITDKDTFIIKKRSDSTVSGTYSGGGTIRRVSNIDIRTKLYNFYLSQGKNSALNKVDFLLDRTGSGEISVDYFSSSSDVGLIDAGESTGSLLGTGVVETYPYTLKSQENNQDRLWHTMYPFITGNALQLRLYMNNNQMIDKEVSLTNFTLHAMILHTNPTGFYID